jgi:hypothetical protein
MILSGIFAGFVQSRGFSRVITLRPVSQNKSRLYLKPNLDYKLKKKDRIRKPKFRKFAWRYCH